MEEIFRPDFSNVNIDKTLPTISISAILGYIAHPFERDKVIELTYNKHHDNPNSQYYQMTREQIGEMWEAKGAESCKYGSLLDDYIGINLTKTAADLRLFKLDNGYDYDERLHGLCDSFDNFYSILSKSGDTVFVDREREVFIKVKNPNFGEEGQTEYMYVKGRFDALFYNKRTNKWIVIDWKSSGTIDKVASKWTKKFLGPMFQFPELNYYSYTLQLHFYKKALIENYLPAGTTENDVVVMIVNLPGKMIDEVGTNFQTHKEAMAYNSERLNQVFDFAIQKDYLTKQAKKNEEAKQPEAQSESKQKEEQENLDIF